MWAFSVHELSEPDAVPQNFHQHLPEQSPKGFSDVETVENSFRSRAL